MQDGGNDRFRIHAEVGENRRNGYGMRNVGFAAFAFLSGVRVGADLICLDDARHLIARQKRQP
ncbi:MAG TPA: hypothetical protein VGN31_20120, partial [Paraburkholderia sp.]